MNTANLSRSNAMPQRTRLTAQFAFAIAFALSSIALIATHSHAGTVAYWRMEGDGVTTPSDGTFVQDTDGRSAIQPAGIAIVDESGNGNTVVTWNNDATGHVYRPDTPATTSTTRVGTNNWSIQNSGG
ncbi:MAG: hypothetical protein KDA60_17185, partial [Planctomycetales bacterium]|nr:hypothetical protein [Planctomycetales bacterium]